MLLLALNIFNLCYLTATAFCRPVLQAHSSLAGIIGWPSPGLRLPTTLHPMFEDFCKEQWQQHVGALEHSSRLSWAMLQKFKSALQTDFVLYNEDHHPNHVVCYCPRFFLRGLCTTWDDPSVFRSLEGSPAEWQAKMLEAIPSRLSRRYSWSFCRSAKLPQGTVFLKRKKQFTKGRTIISYSGSLCSKLLELASVALTLIVKTLYADSPGLLSMPQLWQAIHTHWSSSRNEDETDLEWNDDLVGFFNAVPRADILKAVQCIVQVYSQQTGHTVLAINLLSKTGHPGQPRGKTKSSLKRLWIQDLPSIVDLSFSTGVFTAAGKCRLQVEGTVLGTRFLSSCPVSLSCWQREPFFRRYLQRSLLRCCFSVM